MLAVIALLLTVQCAAPYFERARMEPGWACGGGPGIGFGKYASFRGDPDVVYAEASIVPRVTLYGRYNFSRRFGLFVQATTGIRYELPLRRFSGYLSWALLESAEPQLGAKVGLSERDALRIGIGTVSTSYCIPTPLLFEAAWLHDLNNTWTRELGLGTRGFTAGIGYHFPLSARAEGHVSVSGALFVFPDWERLLWPTGQIGFAVEPLAK